jgi:hypothetical protein
MNNPYSYVVHNHISNYFDSGKAFPYRGMSQEGIKVHFYQRTLQEYMDACLAAGYQLQRLVDLPTPERILINFVTGKLLPSGYQFPIAVINSELTGSLSAYGLLYTFRRTIFLYFHSKIIVQYLSILSISLSLVYCI